MTNGDRPHLGDALSEFQRFFGTSGEQAFYIRPSTGRMHTSWTFSLADWDRTYRLACDESQHVFCLRCDHSSENPPPNRYRVYENEAREFVGAPMLPLEPPEPEHPIGYEVLSWGTYPVTFSIWVQSNAWTISIGGEAKDCAKLFDLA